MQLWRHLRWSRPQGSSKTTLPPSSCRRRVHAQSCVVVRQRARGSVAGRRGWPVAGGCGWCCASLTRSPCTSSCPQATSAREGVVLLGRYIEELGSAEGYGIQFADSKEAWWAPGGVCGREAAAAAGPACDRSVLPQRGRPGLPPLPLPPADIDAVPGACCSCLKVSGVHRRAPLDCAARA